MTWKIFPDRWGRAEWGQASADTCVLAPRFDHMASFLLCLYIFVIYGRGVAMEKKYLAKATFGMRGLFGLTVWGGMGHYFVEGTAGRERPQVTLHLQLGSRER